MSCPTRSECHREAVFIAARPFLLAPALNPAPEELGERFDLVGGEEGGHLLPDRIVHDFGAEEVVGELIEMTEMLSAEVAERLGLEALVSNPRIFSEPLAGIEVAVGDSVERLPVEVAPHLPIRGRAENRPAQVRLDQPRKVVM
jgi:hypothetical protein